MHLVQVLPSSSPALIIPDWSRPIVTVLDIKGHTLLGTIKKKWEKTPDIMYFTSEMLQYEKYVSYNGCNMVSWFSHWSSGLLFDSFKKRYPSSQVQMRKPVALRVLGYQYSRLWEVSRSWPQMWPTVAMVISNAREKLGSWHYPVSGVLQLYGLIRPLLSFKPVPALFFKFYFLSILKAVWLLTKAAWLLIKDTGLREDRPYTDQQLEL